MARSSPPPQLTTTVLLTGFGPFPGVPENASSLLVGRLAARARRRWPQVRFATARLPTEWERGPARLAALLGSLEPDVTIHFGVSARARGLEIETTAQNACAAAPDARDLLPQSLLNEAGGPATRAATLPVERIAASLAAHAIAGGLSHDAGNYLCNGVLYRTLAWCSQRPRPARAGFVHIPAGLVGGSAPREPRADCPLDWPQALAGSLLIIAAALE